MSLIEDLRGLGVNVDEAIVRLNNNEALYERMLVKFITLLRGSTAVLDSDASQCEDMAEVAHAIKGASGNLSVTPVYEAYTKIVSLLREGQRQQAVELIQKIRPVQEEIVRCIEKHANG